MSVAIVTGAGQGIGKAIALRLADDGFDVAINDLPCKSEALELLSAEISAKGRRSCIILADVSVEQEVEDMVTKVVTELGRLDVMVANAGMGFGRRLLDTQIEDWDRVLSVNARSVFICYKLAAKQMIKQGTGGRIIGACSVLGQQGGRFVSAYSASKFAIRGLTQCAATEFGEYGITVNTYAPGAIDTPMMVEAAQDMGGVDAFYEKERNKSPLGMMGEPSDVAGVVSYLASRDGRFVTGS
ncbi:acetoin reductase family protein [Desarmillaria tabescens]|uniref:Acetoin reductase family protein n=1 Tax=Armillaria tabescens TaxID=1929756 RepID=A0AA39J8R0_ARMTA|nr:acetoin reductase family protein [Desarmillaria tabescens]XP_060328484.1 acetoin reductase family protein [Desarmillaria tabescens]KAK0437457.1 acetoin reductase family protein [Desarmillaria tabescens]KAK0454096.1 acetoin reductase family protein [Desarmillaria tabescens]